MKKTVKIKCADILLLTIILLIASFLYFLTSKNQANEVKIFVDTSLAYTISLSNVKEPYTIDLGNSVIVEISCEYVKIISSDCNNKNCIRCGELKNNGDIAVCIPNKTVVKLYGNNNNSQPDIISY